MDPIKKYYFLVLPFLPLLQYLSVNFAERDFVFVYGFLGFGMLAIYYFGAERFKMPRYSWLFVAVFMYYLIWDIINGHMASLKSGFFTYIYSSLPFYTVVMILLIENTRFSKQFIKTLVVLLKITIVAAFVVVMVQLLVDPYFFAPKEIVDFYLRQGIYEVRFMSIFGFLSGNDIGFSLIAILSILIGYHLVERKRFSFIWLVLGGAVAIISNSRWIQLNFIIILFQYAVFHQVKMATLVKYAGILVVFLLATGFVVAQTGFNLDQYFAQRLLNNSATSRFLAIEMFGRFFPEYPFFGTGEHVTEELRRAIGGRSSQIHIGYLSHLYEFGIVGSIILFAAWFFLLRHLQITANQTRYLGSLFAFIAFLVANITLVKYTIFSYGILIALIFNRYYADRALDGSEELNTEQAGIA